MEESLGSFKELYDVHLKATQNIEINGKTFEEGSTAWSNFNTTSFPPQLTDFPEP